MKKSTIIFLYFKVYFSLSSTLKGNVGKPL